MATCERGKLKEDDEKRIQLNFEFLKDEIDGKELVDTMFQNGIYSLDDMEEVKNAMPNIRKSRADVFLTKLLNSGKNGYDAFLTSLKTNGYVHVADRLENTVLPSEVPGDDWFDLVPASRKVDKVMEKDLSRLVTGIGNGWEKFAMELNVKKVQIEQAKAAGGAEYMQIFNALIKWRQREAGKATFQAFVNALHKCEKQTTIDWDIIKTVVLNSQ